MLANVRIVLTRPTGPANVGAVCRAMANFGFADLVLVAPKHPLDHPDTVAYATHGKPVLDQARVVNTIAEALAGCVRSYATSAKLGLFRRQACMPPADAAAELLPLGQQQPVAIAFGPENYGFLTKELLRFDRLITIPTDETFPVLNLAAAVTVCCYELRRTWLQQADHDPLPMALDTPLAPDQRKQILFDKLFTALEKIDYFSAQSPDKLKFALRHLFGRLDLTIHEADVLIGMAQQIDWYARHHGPKKQSPE
jgi:tRNA/rRNA methyltransferase